MHYTILDALSYTVSCNPDLLCPGVCVPLSTVLTSSRLGFSRPGRFSSSTHFPSCRPVMGPESYRDLGDFRSYTEYLISCHGGRFTLVHPISGWNSIIHVPATHLSTFRLHLDYCVLEVLRRRGGGPHDQSPVLLRGSCQGARAREGRRNSVQSGGWVSKWATPQSVTIGASGFNGAARIEVLR